MTDIAILGAGAFGTALAVAISHGGTPVTLIARDADRATAVSSSRSNPEYLPDVTFPDLLSITGALQGVSANTVLLCVPTQRLGEALAACTSELDGRTLVACCKGIDLKSGEGPTKLIAKVIPNSRPALLSGPSFAADIGRNMPTALTLACSDRELGKSLQNSLSNATLRLYLTEDVTGVELGGALKNVMALAAGLTMGAGLGESARASVITRGFAEMQRVAAALGARPETLLGLSGLGDLVLTCTSEKSRNYSAGVALGAGNTVRTETTIEGIGTAVAVSRIVKERGLDAPLIQTVAQIVSGDISVAEAQARLLARPLKDE